MKSKIVKAFQILAILALVAVIIIDWERFLYKSAGTLLIKGIIFVGGWFLFGLLGKDDSSEPNDAGKNVPEARVAQPEKQLSDKAFAQLVVMVLSLLAIVVTIVTLFCILS